MKTLTICCAALALAVAFWLWPTNPGATPVMRAATQQIREHLSQRQLTPFPAPVSGAHSETLPPTTAAGPRQRLRTAGDYFQLALSILPLARAGNAEAQYVIYKTFRQCQMGHEGYYARDFDTVEKATEEAALRNFSTEEAARLYRKCHGFFTPAMSALGDPWGWLQRATDAQYPAAQAATADERLLQDRLKAFAPPGAQLTDIAALSPIGGNADPRVLLASALPSGDPEVLATIGQLQRVLYPDQPREVTHLNRVAWLYVACERGNDCSNLGPTSPINCTATDTQCMGVPSTLRAMAQDNWAPVQDRVNEINAALDARQWDKLGFGP